MIKKQKIISSALLVVGFVAGATALSAVAGTWTAPGTGYPAGTDCRPPNCNVDAPLNVGALSQVKIGLLGLNDLIVENLQVLTGEGTTTATAGKVLMALDNDGTVGWRSVDGQSTTNNTASAFKPLAQGAIIAYGENGTREPYAYDDARNWVKVVSNPLLEPGKKYAFVLLTGGQQEGYRVLGANLGADSNMKIKSRCYDNGWSNFPITAQTYSPYDMPDMMNSFHRVTYQGTFVYNPSESYASYSPLSLVWGLWPGTNGQTLSFQTIAKRTTNCSDPGKGSYAMYIYDYNDLKNTMDRMYSVTKKSTHKFNDPLSSDPALHNGSAWKY